MQTAITLEAYDAANPQHKEQFAALNREWLNQYFKVEPFDEDIFADPEGQVIDKGGVILFARAGDEIVGTGSLLPLEKGCYEIAKMGVTKHWQKNKIGEQLIIALLDRAAKLKAKKLYIVSNTVLENAIRLYRRHGFVDSPEVRHGHYERGNITLELPL